MNFAHEAAPYRRHTACFRPRTSPWRWGQTIVLGDFSLTLKAHSLWGGYTDPYKPPFATSTGHQAKQYWSLLVTYTGPSSEQYWLPRGPVLVKNTPSQCVHLPSPTYIIQGAASEHTTSIREARKSWAGSEKGATRVTNNRLFEYPFLKYQDQEHHIPFQASRKQSNFLNYLRLFWPGKHPFTGPPRKKISPSKSAHKEGLREQKRGSIMNIAYT